MLAFSLCLTVIMIILTIIRTSRTKADNHIDIVWESYFIIVAAEVGIILTAVSAFRALYLSRQKRDVYRNQHTPQSDTPWYSPSRYLIKRIFTLSFFRSKSRGSETSAAFEADSNGKFPMPDLPGIPRAHMTGVRTLIGGVGEDARASRIMERRVLRDDDDDWPLRTRTDPNSLV